MGGKSKTLALLLVLLFLISSVLLTHSNVKAQTSGNTSAPAIQWQQRYGGSTEAVSNLIQTSDGGYAFMDIGYSYQNFHEPATVFKVDPKGNLQWSKTIALFSGSEIIQTNDKGYEISGRWYTPSLAITPTLIKMSTDGEIQWVQNYTTLPDLGVNSTTYNSPYPIGNPVGGNVSTSDSGSIYWTYGNITKNDSKNNTQWVKTLTYDIIYNNSSAPILLASVIETSDGAIATLGIAPAGYATFPTQGIMYLVKLEPFLPIPSPTQLPTPMPTPIPTPAPSIGDLVAQYAIPILTVAVLVVVIIFLLLYRRRHLKTADLKK